MTETSGLKARAAALALLDGVLSEHRMLSDQVAAPKGPLAKLDAADRARAQRLATSVLRNLRPADQILGPFLRNAPYLHIHNILRLATVEMLALGAAPHGVVSEAVTLARMHDPESKAPGLVNAVLRKVSGLDATAWSRTGPTQLPKFLRKPLVAAYGGKTVAAIEASHRSDPPLDLTPRDPGGAATLAEALSGVALPTGSVRLTKPGQVSDLPGYAEGEWWVQDAGAALPVMLLDPSPGERIADLCAAPGGKTMQLAARGCDVTAVDLSDARLQRVRENLSRTGLSAEVVQADALTWDGGPFDAILLDAPCSATGTIRRHPDLPHVRQPDQIAELVTLQAELLRRAVALLRPGGRLLFATCSLLPEEGEGHLAMIRETMPELSLVSLDARLAEIGGDPEWLTPEGAVRLRPDYWADSGGIDGFFIAVFQKSADPHY